MANIIRHGGAALALALLFTALGTGRAHAQSREGDLRLGADITVFNGSWYPDFDYATYDIGVLGGTGPEVAYQLSDAILIGGRLEFGDIYNYNPVTGDGFDSGIFQLLAQFEYDIVGDSVVQPFFGAEAGYRDFFGQVSSSGEFIVHGLGGVHLFITNDFSISPEGYVGVLYDFDGAYAGLDWAVTVNVFGWINTNSDVAVTVQ